MTTKVCLEVPRISLTDARDAVSLPLFLVAQIMLTCRLFGPSGPADSRGRDFTGAVQRYCIGRRAAVAVVAMFVTANAKDMLTAERFRLLQSKQPDYHIVVLEGEAKF